MGKEENKGVVRDLVESRAVRDMGWEEKEVWRRAEDMVKSWKKKQRGMRVVAVQEEVKKLRKNGKGRERVVQAFGRVYTSGFERIEFSEEHLCIRKSRGEILGYRIRLSPAIFGTFRRSAIALPRICHQLHCRVRSSVSHWVVWSDYSPKGKPCLGKQFREKNDLGDQVCKR
jgi:hypothetical protein